MYMGHFPNLLPTQPHQFPHGHAIANGFMSFCGAIERLREKKECVPNSGFASLVPLWTDLLKYS